MESVINTSSVNHKAGGVAWSGPEITVICSDGQVVVKRDKLAAAGKFFAESIDDIQDGTVDLSKDPPVQITKACMEKTLEFTELTKGFTPVLQKPLRTKQTMYQATSPALANFADSFGKIQDDYETLAHMILVANYLDNQALIDVLSCKLALVLVHMTNEQIRKFFNIQQPFATPADEERVKKENEEAAEIYDLNAEWN